MLLPRIISILLTTAVLPSLLKTKTPALHVKFLMWLMLLWLLFIQLDLSWCNTVKVPERVRFWHENVHVLLANHSSSCQKCWAVIGYEVYIFPAKSYTVRNLTDGTCMLEYSIASNHAYAWFYRDFDNSVEKLPEPFSKVLAALLGKNDIPGPRARLRLLPNKIFQWVMEM